MKAVVFNGVDKLLSVERLDDPEPGEGEVVIRVERCGVCGTDVHATNGHGKIMHPGAQFGHEFAGEVVAVGPGLERLKMGDIISAMPSYGCGKCEYCATGISFLCAERQSCGKALAEYCKVPERNSVTLPKTVAIKDGALIEPIAVGRRGVRLLNPGLETRALVMGSGPIGLGVIFWLQRAGVRKIAVLASSTRRKSFVEALGIDNFIVESDDARQAIEVSLGGPPAMVFEAAGVPGVVARALDLVAPGGQIMALGFCGMPETIIPSQAVSKDVTIRFSITYTLDDYQACADALDTGADALRRMVTEVVSLKDFPQSFEPLRQGTYTGCKLVCDPWI